MLTICLSANFGPLNVPRSLRSVEILGILQSRKWYVIHSRMAKSEAFIDFCHIGTCAL